MISCFNASSADELWSTLVTSFKEGSDWALQEGRGGPTYERLHVALSIQNPLNRWMVSRNPPINPAFAIAEIVWILTGRDDSAFLRSFFPGIGSFQGEGETLSGAYGARLKKHFGINQLERAYEALKNNQASRQIVLQIWDARSDFPDTTGVPASNDIPCNVCSLVKVRNGYLEWTQIIRSNDAFRGLPYNIVQFTTLQEVLAGWLGLKVGSYNQLSDSLHFYSSDAETVSDRPSTTACENTDSLMQPREQSLELFNELARRVDVLRAQEIDMDQFEKIARWDEAPMAFRNLSLVMSAEISRRKKWLTVSNSLAQEITNPALSALWSSWILRTKSNKTARINDPDNIHLGGGY